MRTRIIAILALLATALGTHADNVVTVVTQNGQKSYDMDKLARIELGEDDLVVVGSDEDSNIAAPLYVYDAGGRSVLHREAWRGETVSISALAKGVYVVKAGEHTAKFRK